ncbi:ABC transporter permease [Chryseolinea soli]|uniref:FtsX-like permease family protein n=1 Tax=Chryseolinea soli TaxID=2321403 RepID=A0A385SN43_9BACT|nr:ABC transporter permease [Chryseolinea soli]AYB31677.1 FtsX-like permease family protein [Chryseolinea soli]
MLISYLLVAWRNVLRHKVFSLINISGLSIGMTAVMLIYFYVQSERSFDRFSPDSDRIYRVPLSYYYNGSSIPDVDAANHAGLASALKANYPEVEISAHINPSTTWVAATVVSYEDQHKSIQFNETKLYFADPTFIPLFGFKMLEGDPATSLEEPRSLVLTKKAAVKYFGDESALGRSIRVNNEDYKVTGVMADLPPYTHLDFELLSSYPHKDFGVSDWGWTQFLTYIKVKPQTDVAALEAKFPALLDKYVRTREAGLGYKTAIHLQPISEIHLKSHFDREMKDNGDERTVYFIGMLGVMILAIAWINYINISTARAMERAKEVGMRKVSGATRKQLVTQFLLDASLINCLAVLLTVVLTTAFLPAFERLAGSPISAILTGTGVWATFSFWIIPVMVLIAGILVVGVYPALLLSSFKPLSVLKGKFVKSSTGALLRKGLVGFQYVLSVILIAGTITISRQVSFMQAQDLGYTQEQVLVVKGPSAVDSTSGTRFQYFRNEQMKLPEIIKMGRSLDVPGRMMLFVNEIRPFGTPVSENVAAYEMSIDDQFFSTFEIPLIAGADFSEDDRFSFPNYPDIPTLILPHDRTFHPERNKIIINEELSKKLGFKDPQEAIHQKVRFRLWDEFTGEIAGVVKNYHQQSLHKNYEPIFYFFGDFEQWPSISIRLTTTDLPGTIEKIRKNYAAAFPGNPFEYYFVDEYFNEQYNVEQKFEHVFTVLTVVAIFISCLGLLGLGIYNVAQRIREIGIRKVLGAPVSSILLLFCKDSLYLLAGSCSIALPVVWLGVQSWLNNFAFHIGLEWIIFVVPPVMLLIISTLTIVAISMRAATTNPVETLRTE